MAELVIVGAGLAGISAAYHAKLEGKETAVYEAQKSWGGLVDHFSIDGFRFDKAIHLSFTKDKYVRSIFDKTPYLTHIPLPLNYEKGLWLKHPVQNNLYPLALQDKVKAVEGFINRPQLTRPSNYQDWLIQQYGSYIAERFPVKYTRKYWTVSSEEMSLQWIGNRMYRPQLEEVLLGAMTDQTPQTYYAKEMRYPQQGGFRSFLDPLVSEQGVTIQTLKKAVHVNSRYKYVQFADGDKVYYEHLISSIPLPALIPIIDSVPNDVMEAARSLWATSVALVSVGFNKPKVVNTLWFYIYDEDILPARVNVPSLKSPHNAPPNCSSLQFEIYFSPYQPLPLSKEHLIEHIVDSIETMKLASRNEIIVTDVRIEPYANVVFDHGMISRREKVKAYLKNISILPVGRFGAWDYYWSDQSLLSGKRAVEKIINTFTSS